MTDPSSDLSDDDGIFSSEDILRSMGFTTSLIEEAVQKIPQCTTKSGSTGISKLAESVPSTSINLVNSQHEDMQQLQHVTVNDTSDLHKATNTTDIAKGKVAESVLSTSIDLEISQHEDRQQLQDVTINDTSDLMSYNSSIFSDVNLSSCSMVEKVTDLGMPNVFPDLLDTPTLENKHEKRQNSPSNVLQRRKKMKIYEDLFSDEESNPDDPDYVNEENIEDEPAQENEEGLNNMHEQNRPAEENEEPPENENRPTNVLQPREKMKIYEGLFSDEESNPDDPDFVNEENIEDEPAQENEEGLNNIHEQNRPAKENEEPPENENRPTKIRNKNNKHNWSKNLNYVKRQKGEAYVGYRRCGPGKIAHDVPKEAKVLGPRCESNVCAKSKFRACDTITEEERQSVFNGFWKKMTWDQRRVYIVSLVEKVGISRKRSKAENSRRSDTLKYFLVVRNERQQVCQRTFLNTLGIKKWTVRYWVNEEGQPGTANPRSNDNKIVAASKIIHSSQKGQPKKMEDINFLKDFLKSLPKVPSHYCRSSSTKLYVEPTFDSITELYECYVDECKNSGKNVMSRYTFDKVFENNNFALFQPKKDVCDTCNSYKIKSGTISKQEYEEHIIQKDRAHKEKENDKKRGKDQEISMFTQDTQAVKLAPCINASAMYYKTKLCVHNFTMYNNVTKDAITYWWDETQSDLSASSFASCVVDNLRKTLSTDLKPIVLWSDGCCYQNRSSIMSNALLHLAKEQKVVIEQKYLVKGHTMMECDSVHSTIDTILNPKRGTRNKKTVKEIYLPSQYAQLAREARKKPFPYRSEYLDFTFFRDFSKKDNMIYESIRPGKRLGDPKVTDLRALKYNPNGTIEYKLSFDDTYTPLPIRPKLYSVCNDFPPLNNGRLKIKKPKWDHLQELKAHIPQDCHDYYNNIPFEV